MSADPRFHSERVKRSSFAAPIYFDSGDHRLFGWLQSPPDGWLRNTGLVICKPFGYEAICAHRGLRAFSEAAAGLGVPTLRVDYLGTGDSPDIDPDCDQIKVWTADVVAAVQELCRRTGVQSVCILGVRLGAVLAALAAEECAAVTSLILISPLLSGRKYLRELRTIRLASATEVTDLRDKSARSMEVGGFLFSAATLASLAELDLLKRPACRIDAALVIDGTSLPVASRLAQHLSDSGIQTQYQTLPGLIEMIMRAPQYTAVPLEMISAIQDWLLLRSMLNGSATASLTSDVADAPRAPDGPVIALLCESQGQRVGVTELPVFFGACDLLFGIVAEPQLRERNGRAVILLNAGADHHVGANGMHVALARQWASGGYVVLRMDLAGIGDSGTRPGEPDNQVFPAAALDDIRSAIDFLGSRFGSMEITLFGLCSGAYHALRAAEAELPVKRILLVNPQNYSWKEGMDLNALQLAEVVRNPGVYGRQMFSATAWKRMLTGHVNVWRIVKIAIWRPALSAESRLRDLARWLHFRLPQDLGNELERIVARGVEVVFVFARGEPGHELLQVAAGSSLRTLGERCRIHIIDGADHVFSESAPRAVMEQILSDELFHAE